MTGGRSIGFIAERYALGPQDERPVRNVRVVAKIFMPAGHSCVIEFEHISAAFALPTFPLARARSPFPSFYAAIYTAISGRRGLENARRKTGRSFERQLL